MREYGNVGSGGGIGSHLSGSGSGVPRADEIDSGWLHLLDGQNGKKRLRRRSALDAMEIFRYSHPATSSRVEKIFIGANLSLHLRWSPLSTLALAIVLFPVGLQAQHPAEIPELILRAAHNQDQSMAVRDRMRYRQELTVTRFALEGGSMSATPVDEDSGKKLGERTTVVTIEPSLTPDEKGRYEVIVRVVSDTDDHGQPKSKIDPKAQPGLLVEVLWDELFFPLQEEKLSFLKFESLSSADPDIAQFHFEPKSQSRAVILASGKVFIEVATGNIKEVEIDSLYNLRTIHKQLDKLERISAQIEYAPFRGVWNLPSYAIGQGVSRLPHLEGFFRFSFKESGYEPVMKIPEPDSEPQ
jgi:hypothetical protein